MKRREAEQEAEEEAARQLRQAKKQQSPAGLLTAPGFPQWPLQTQAALCDSKPFRLWPPILQQQLGGTGDLAQAQWGV